MNANPLAIIGLQHAQVDLVPEAVERRDRLASEARAISMIDDALDADAAAAILRDLASALKLCESGRQEIKSPVLDLTRRIDATAKAFAEPLEAEKARLSRLLGVWQTAERERAERERRAAEEAARKAAAEAAAQAARLAAEAEFAATPADAAKAEQERVAVVEQGEAATIAARVAIAQAAPVQPKGAAVRKTLKFEVVDAAALLAARPDCFSPDDAKIRAALKLTPTLPGVRTWEDIQTIVR